MIAYEHSLTAAVDHARVWDRWTLVENWPVDNPDIVRAKLNGPIAQGAGGWVKMRRVPRSSFQLTQVDRMGGRFELAVRILLCTLTITHELRRAEVDGNDGKQDSNGGKPWVLTNRITFAGPLAPFWGRLVGPSLSASMERALGKVAGAAAL